MLAKCIVFPRFSVFLQKQLVYNEAEILYTLPYGMG